MQHFPTLPVVCLTLLAVALPCAAKPTEWPVALHNVSGQFVTASPGGGLILGGASAHDRTTFTLVDIKGGALAAGDVVQLRFGNGRGSSLWREGQGHVSRKGGHADKTCLFRLKWKQEGQSLQLQAPSGKYVSAPTPGKGLVTAAASNPATIFVVIKNPAPQQGRSAATPKKSAAAKPH